MYVAPSARKAWDAVWHAVSSHLRKAGMQDAPALLDWQQTQHELCQHPSLLLGQCCGFPLLESLHKYVTPLLSFAYDIQGCEGTQHSSVILVHKTCEWQSVKDATRAHAIINERNSNTGMNLFRHTLAPLAGGDSFFKHVSLSGAHHASMAAVAEGRANITCVDCISYHYACQDYPEHTSQLRVIARTASSPTPPLVVQHTLPEEMVDMLRHAFLCVLADPEMADTVRTRLRITGAESLTLDDYAQIDRYAAEAKQAGYAELA